MHLCTSSGVWEKGRTLIGLWVYLNRKLLLIGLRTVFPFLPSSRLRHWFPEGDQAMPFRVSPLIMRNLPLRPLKSQGITCKVFTLLTQIICRQSHYKQFSDPSTPKTRLEKHLRPFTDVLLYQ